MVTLSGPQYLITVLIVAACSSPTAIQNSRVSTVVSGPTLPDTVHAGQPFIVAFVTEPFGTCGWRASRIAIKVSGLQADLTPYDSLLPFSECDLPQESRSVGLMFTGLSNLPADAQVVIYSADANTGQITTRSVGVVVTP